MARSRALARDALEKFRAGRLDLTLALVSDSLRFMHPALLNRYICGLKIAGLE